MNEFVCKMCLIIQDPAKCKQLFPEETYNNVFVSSMIKLCIPEMIMDVHPHEWICQKCLQALFNFYEFKTMCLKNISKYTSDLNETFNKELPFAECDITLTPDNDMINNRITKIDVNENDICEVPKAKDPIKKKTFTFYRKRFMNGNCSGCKNRVLDVKYHSKVHNNYYDCLNCGRRFPTVNDIRKHIYTHTLLYKCEICGKQWSGKYALEVHLRSHTKERPFECPVCQKKFAQSYALHQHLAVHQGDDDNCNRCPICAKVLSTKYNLKIHMTSHNISSKPRCPKCNKWFYTKAAQIKHSELCELLIPKAESDIIETDEPELIKTESSDFIKEELDGDKELDDDIFVEIYQHPF